VRWELGREIQKDENILTTVYVDGAFARHFNNLRYEPEEVKSSLPLGLNFNCFVLRYTLLTNENFMHSILNRFENSRTINQFIINPKIVDSINTPGLGHIKPEDDGELEKLRYTKEYKTPIFNLLGKKAYYGAYCR
jgi:hypothetical protein